MWQRLGNLVIKFRLPLLIVLFAATGVMGFFASKVKLSYEFARAIPTDNPKYKIYKSFKEKFGDDGNLLVLGIQSKSLFELDVFKAYAELHRQVKKVNNVEDVLSVPFAVSLLKDSANEKLIAARIFSDSITTQAQLDTARAVFYNLPFYRSLLYNPDSAAYLMAIRINKDTLNSPKRTQIVNAISEAAKKFETATKINVHLSGLPLIRTVVADRIQQEMKFFLLGSLIMSSLILLLFFRSASTMLLSLLVVLFGVIWSLGIVYLCGYKITLLTALIPSLVVVIGIPNCIYFINKYHTSYLQRLSSAHSSTPLGISQAYPSTSLRARGGRCLSKGGGDRRPRRCVAKSLDERRQALEVAILRDERDALIAARRGNQCVIEQ